MTLTRTITPTTTSNSNSNSNSNNKQQHHQHQQQHIITNVNTVFQINQASWKMGHESLVRRYVESLRKVPVNLMLMAWKTQWFRVLTLQTCDLETLQKMSQFMWQIPTNTKTDTYPTQAGKSRLTGRRGRLFQKSSHGLTIDKDCRFSPIKVLRTKSGNLMFDLGSSLHSWKKPGSGLLPDHVKSCVAQFRNKLQSQPHKQKKMLKQFTPSLFSFCQCIVTTTITTTTI